MFSSAKLKNAAPVVLRLGLVAVLSWFAVNQLTNPGAWTGLIPAWVTSLSGLSAGAFVHLNALFEIACAILLAVGFWVRPIAFLLSLHLMMIVFDLGLSATGVRDIGLAVAMFALALYGNDTWCCEHSEPTP